MNDRLGGKRGKWLVLALLLVGYAALSHYSNIEPRAKGLAAALSLGPLLLIAVIVMWRALRPLTATLLTGTLALVVYLSWGTFERHYEWSDLAQQVLIYGLIAASFALSLRADRVPLCTQLALTLHGPLEPREVTYLRRATTAWALFYALIAAAVLVLFFTATLQVWSLFVNVLVFAAIALMCLADHFVRRRVLPRRAGGGLVTALRQALIG